MNDQDHSAPGQNAAATGAQSTTPPQATPFAFCQNCGRPLSEHTARVVGQSVFCEPCLEARVAGAAATPPPGAGAYPGYPPDPSASAWVSGAPGIPGSPNPGLATLLGFIPGVGAMYNEQYAKGIVHLIVFVVLVTAADSFGIFGLFVAGWEFYMAIDANHTARARRDGLPLPNPFGLNDIGERLGFGKAWPGNPNMAGAAQQAARTAAQQAAQAMRDAADFAGQATSRGPGQAAPFTAQNAAPVNPYQSPAWNATYTGTTPPYQPGYPAAPLPPDAAPVAPTALSRFPAGAVWLIGLGSIFLLATTGLFDSVRPNALFGLILIGLGGWVFARRMAESGLGWRSDGSAAYRYRIFRALRVAIWLFAIGLWFLLDAVRWTRLHHTWPLLLIIGGVLALLERLFFNASQAELYPGAEPFVAAEPYATVGSNGNGDWQASGSAVEEGKTTKGGK